ncbi:hypothetical protein [Mesorhizobium sp. CO1-1-9]|uniref:hypothetical protein n=1 Tax=Mesorhizobium sp. CO1-1-9 TaxID=2876630 RepID=UPI001CC9F591|nr:hypothetical protein [Mesorhizobium sp. CO1-1-9]MBZ9698828.1 hypothetical protein [Mesorhizobium sp. CO1-1-9]
MNVHVSVAQAPSYAAFEACNDNTAKAQYDTLYRAVQAFGEKRTGHWETEREFAKAVARASQRIHGGLWNVQACMMLREI